MHISKEEIKGEKKKEVDILKYRKVKVFSKKVRKYFLKNNKHFIELFNVI